MLALSLTFWGQSAQIISNISISKNSHLELIMHTPLVHDNTAHAELAIVCFGHGYIRGIVLYTVVRSTYYKY